MVVIHSQNYKTARRKLEIPVTINVVAWPSNRRRFLLFCKKSGNSNAPISGTLLEANCPCYNSLYPPLRLDSPLIELFSSYKAVPLLSEFLVWHFVVQHARNRFPPQNWFQGVTIVGEFYVNLVRNSVSSD